jgi:hypothetical protein
MVNLHLILLTSWLSALLHWSYVMSTYFENGSTILSITKCSLQVTRGSMIFTVGSPQNGIQLTN